jgi:hypothetical protein
MVTAKGILFVLVGLAGAPVAASASVFSRLARSRSDPGSTSENHELAR